MDAAAHTYCLILDCITSKALDDCDKGQ